jgi:hypothetical protein
MDCKNWNKFKFLFFFHPNHREIRFSPLVIAFPLSLFFSRRRKKKNFRLERRKKKLSGRNKNSTIPSPSSSLYCTHKTIGRDSTTTPPVPPSLFRERKDPSSCERRFFALDISPPLLLFLLPGVCVHHWNIIPQKYQKRKKNLKRKC